MSTSLTPTARRRIIVAAIGLPLALSACGMGVTGTIPLANGSQAGIAVVGQSSPAATTPGAPGSMTMAQTLSDQAQLTTIAFDGLAFLTGSLGSDSFFPPGKVADWWGFQYLRDNDPSGNGHNTDFLTKASLNMLDTLSSDQRAQLIALAKEQVPQIQQYGYDRFTLMAGFRRLLSGDLPTGTNDLSATAVKQYSATLYGLDGDMSLRRAQVMGGILHDLSANQRASLDALVGTGMSSWPTKDEPSELRALTGDEKVAVMTYAGDLFSWYAGSLKADVYFCPERQGTYFGSFYLKDAKAVGNPGYSIGTNITADMGNAFLAVLTPSQRATITSLVTEQKSALTRIVKVRRAVALELRKYIAGGQPDTARIKTLMASYGALDGVIVHAYATAFAKVGKTLTDAQMAKLMDLRQQTVGDLTPTGAYLYATPIDLPTGIATDFLFSR